MTGTATAISRVVTTPFRWGSAARGARVFHPNGIVCRAVVTVSDERPPALPIRSGPATVRLSKAVGTAGGTVDIAGMALRLGVRGETGTTWDVLFASSAGPAQRVGIPFPVSGWADSTLSTLAPFRFDRHLVYLRVVLDDQRAPASLSLKAMKAAVNVAHDLRFALEEATGTEPFRRIGDVVLTGIDDCECIDFNPTGTLPTGITLFPSWLTALRSGAYYNSRRGRPDSSHD